MASRYAQGTTVSAERTKAEIERTLVRYGADNIVTGQSREQRSGMVMFSMEGRQFKMAIPLPDPNDPAFASTPSGRKRRRPEQAIAEWEKTVRQQWRVLCLLIKAQLEAVANGLYTIEEAMLPWLLLPTGRSVGEEMAQDDRLGRALAGSTTKLLPMFPNSERGQS